MYASKTLIIEEKSRNGLAAVALAIISMAFPVGQLFAESATRADANVGMGMAILVWVAGAILVGAVFRVVINIFWHPRPAYFSESPISLTSYLVGIILFSGTSFCGGHSYHVYEQQRGELSRHEEQVRLSEIEKQQAYKKEKSEQESLNKLMNMTLAEKRKAARDSMANVPAETSYEQLAARVPNLYCENVANPRIKLCHGRFDKEVFNYTLIDGKVYNANGIKSPRRHVSL
jgi:hypothetical protein